MTQDPATHVTETLTVTVGVLGRAETATGTAFVDVEVPADLPRDEQSDVIGHAVGQAWRRAYVDAVTEFSPVLQKHWADQAERARDTEG